jgi:hypothetical protein
MNWIEKVIGNKSHSEAAPPRLGPALYPPTTKAGNAGFGPGRFDDPSVQAASTELAKCPNLELCSRPTSS